MKKKSDAKLIKKQLSKLLLKLRPELMMLIKKLQKCKQMRLL